MGEHENKRVKDIRTEVRNGKMIRVIVYSDGSTDEKEVGQAVIDRMLDTIRKTPDLMVVQGGKRAKSAGKGAADALGFVVTIGALVLMAMGLSSCRMPSEDGRCTGPNWHRYDECY